MVDVIRTKIRIGRGVSRKITYEGAVGRAGRESLSDADALAIAASWQAPTGVGSSLASLASGVDVAAQDVMWDVALTLRDAEHSTQADRVGLVALAEWVLRQVASEGEEES
jgi:hypothetical protein